MYFKWKKRPHLLYIKGYTNFNQTRHLIVLLLRHVSTPTSHYEVVQFTVHIWGHVSTRMSLHQVIFWTMFKVYNLQCTFGDMFRHVWVFIKLSFEPCSKCTIYSAYLGTCFDSCESSSSYLSNHVQSAQFTVHIWGPTSHHQAILWAIFKV